MLHYFSKKLQIVHIFLDGGSLKQTSPCTTLNTLKKFKFNLKI